MAQSRRDILSAVYREMAPPCQLSYYKWDGGNLKLDHISEVGNIKDAWIIAADAMVASTGGNCFIYGRIICTWKGVRQFAMEID